MSRRIGNDEVHAAHVDAAAADQDRTRVRRDLLQRRRQDQHDVVVPRAADSGRVFRVGRRAAELVEAVMAVAVGRGRGEDVAAGVLQLDGDAGGTADPWGVPTLRATPFR